MAKGALLKEVTRLGNDVHYLNDVLYYSSDRTVENYKRMRMYPMCFLGLNFIKLGLPNVPPVFECQEDENIRLITEKVFKKIWKRMVQESLECLDFGFKAMEIRWVAEALKYYDENEAIQTYEGILLKQPKGLDGETIEILTEIGDGSFRGFWQDYETAKTCLAKDKKALVFTNHLESGQYYGISAMEPVYPFWYDANINRQFHMRWLEKKGTGIYKGRYPTGTSDVDGTDTDNQDIMLDLLDSIIEGVTVSLPSGSDEQGNLLWDIGMVDESGDKTDPFVTRANYIDEMILKGLVIPEKALTQGEVGARASIESFQSMFVTRKQEILDTVVDTIDKFLVQPFIEINFGVDVECHVRSGKLDDASVQVAMEITKKLIESGKEVTEQQWMIDKTGIPLEERPEPEEIIPEEEEEIPEEGEEEIEPVEPEKDEKEKPTKEELKKEKDKKEKMAEKNRWRALSKRELKYNLNQLDGELDARGAQYEQDMTDNINLQTDRVIRYLDREWNPDKYVSLVAGIEYRTGGPKVITRKFYQDAYDIGYNSFQSGVENKVGLAGQDGVKQTISSKVNTNINIFIVTLKEKVKQVTSGALRAQAGKKETFERIRREVDKYLKAKLPTISETEIGFMLDKSNKDYYLLNKKLIKKGLLDKGKSIERFQYSAILDDKTCDLCMALDEQYGSLVVTAESPIMSQYATPIHYHCRCVWLPITQDEIDNPKIEHTDLTLDKKGNPVNASQVTQGLGKALPNGKEIGDYKTFGENHEH